MKQLKLLLSLLILLPVFLVGQNYFNKYYPFDSHVSNFRTLLVDRDTILLEGIFLDTIDPFLQGIAFAKIDSSGNLLSYQRYFDPLGRDLTYPPLNNLIKTSNGGYATVAMTYQDDGLLIIFLTSKFLVDTVFEYFTNDPTVKVNYLRSVFELDDGYMIFGSAQRLSFASDGQIFRIKKNGELLWRKWYGIANKDEFIGDVAWYYDSTFIISSFHKPFPVSSQNKLHNTWIFQIDLQGNILNEFVDPDLYSGTSGGLVIDKNKNIYYTGTSIIEDMYGMHNGLGRIGMLNENFDLQWKITFGKNESIFTGLTDMILMNNSLIAVGTHVDTSRSSTGLAWNYLAGWSVMANINGDSLCERFDTATWYPSQGSSWGIFRALDTLSSGSIITCGEGWFGPEDDQKTFAWLVKMPNPPCEGLMVNSTELSRNVTISLEINPNPTGEEVRILWDKTLINGSGILMLYEINGKIVRRLKVTDNISSTSLSLIGLPEGIYIIQFQSDKGYLLGYGKIIVQR